MKAKFNKVKDKTKALLKQGLTPKQLSQSVIVSGLISTIPILGLSTFLITTVSLKRKLNLPIMLALSYLMWTIQIILVIPFIRVGEFILTFLEIIIRLMKLLVPFKIVFF